MRRPVRFRCHKSFETEVRLDLSPRDRALATPVQLLAGIAGGANVREVLGRLDEALQVVCVDHRGDSAASAGQEHRSMSNSGLVDDICQPSR